MMTAAKRLSIPIFLIGHITKEGTIAGPKSLEHIVDTVLYFEGDKFQNYRVVRAYKNRFGPVNEVAIYQMHNNGLEEVPNPSVALIAQRSADGRGERMAKVQEDTERLLTPAEVASMFRVDPKTVTRWAKAGKLSSIRTLGGHRRYRESEIRGLIDGSNSRS